MSEGMGTESVAVDLLAEPRDLSMRTRGDFYIGIAATNLGPVTVDPGLHLVRLLVNGQDSLAFSEAILNGMREAKWDALPPGESVSMTWGSMGEILFPSPGTYTMMLSLGDVESAPVVVHVGS